MATERIQIIVSERGSRTVRREIEGIGDGALRAEGAVTLLKRTLGLIGVGALVRELVQLSDTYTNIQNRLKLVTTDTANLAAVTEELFRISNETRSSFEGTATVYARVALAAKDLGRSQKEILEFTESLNQAVILSGASAREAEGALIQLAQGLASNTLQGDELRSVLEQLPFVADVIAKHLNVTRGELREMGKEGKISAQIVLDAFKEARVEIGEKFAQTVPTIGQSLQVLKNRVLELWGAFMEGSGVQSFIAQGLLAIATHLDTIARIVAVVAVVYAVNWIKNAIVAGTVAIVAHVQQLIALEIALGATSRTAAVAGIAMKGLQMLWSLLPGLIFAAIVALVMFSDKLALTKDSTTTLQDFFVATWNVITGQTIEARKELEEFNKKLDETKGKTEDAAKPTFLVDFKREIMGVGKALDDIASETGQVVLVIHALWLGLGNAIAEAWIDGINACIRFLNKFSSGVITLVNGVLGLFTGLVAGIVAAFSAVPQALRSIFQKGFNELARMSESFLNTLVAGLNQLPFLDIASVKLGRMAQEDMPDIGAKAAEGFKQGFAAGQIFDANALNIAELENQYAGAGERLGKALNNAMEFEFRGTQEALEKIFAEADALAAARDVDNKLNPAGPPAPPGEDDEKKAKAKKKLKDAEEEARKALARFLLELDREIVLLGMSAREAERQAAIWQLEDQMKRKLTESEHALVEERLKAWQLAKDNKVIRDTIKDLQDEAEVLRLVGKEQRIRAQLLALEKELQRELTPEEEKRIELLLRENEALTTQNQLLNDTVGKRQELLDKLAAIQALQADPTSGFTHGDAMGELNSMFGGAFEGTPDFINSQLEQLQFYYDTIAAMRETDFEDARTKSQALAQLEYQMMEIRLQTWSSFFGQLAGLASSGNKKLAAIGKAAAVAQAIIDGVLAVQKAYTTLPYPMNLIAAAAQGALAAMNVAKIISTNANFATGAQFTVGGSPGVDTNPVMMNLTRGERVTVETARQQRLAAAGGGGGGPTVIKAQIINQLDPSDVVAFLDSGDYDHVIVNAISRNSNQVTEIVGGSAG